MLDDTNNNVIDSINTISANALPSESNKTQVESVIVTIAHKEREEIFSDKFPASEQELLSLPYESIQKYFKVLYYDQAKPMSHRITLDETTDILGMTTNLNSVLFDADDVELSVFVILAYVEDADGKNFGSLLKFRNKLNKDKFVYISSSDISANKHLQILLDAGFQIADNTDVRARFKKLLTRSVARIPYVVPYVDKLGYSETHHGFFMPDGLYLADTKKYAWFDNQDEKFLDKVMPKGTSKGWLEIMNEVTNYKLPAFAVICPFAAYVLQILDAQTTFFHFYGKSSRGKTSLLQFATSVHANACDPNMGNSFIQKWNSTKAGLEITAELFDGSMGAFDELHMMDDKDFSNVIYAMSSGTGKMRSDGAGQAQKQRDWKFLGLSSGEQSGFEKDYANATLGKMIRFLDIPVKGQVFTDFEGNELPLVEAEALAFKLKQECGLHYGHAGRNFVQQLLQLADSKESLKALIEKDMQDMFQKLTDGIDLEAEELRLMRSFAMIAVAGNYAVMFDILPMTEQRVFDAVVHVRDLWLIEMEHFHQQKANKENYVQMLRNWFSKNRAKFVSQYEPKPKSTSKGFFKVGTRGEANDIYLLPMSSFDEIFGSHKNRDVCDDLIEQGILLPTLDQNGDVKRNQRSYRIPSAVSGKEWLYTIDAAILYANNASDVMEDDDDEFDDIDSSAKQMADMRSEMQELKAMLVAALSK